MIPLLLAAAKFAIGGASGVLAGLVVGKIHFAETDGKGYARSALFGYAAGFVVNFGVNYLLGNLVVHP